VEARERARISVLYQWYCGICLNWLLLVLLSRETSSIHIHQIVAIFIITMIQECSHNMKAPVCYWKGWSGSVELTPLEARIHSREILHWLQETIATPQKKQDQTHQLLQDEPFVMPSILRSRKRKRCNMPAVTAGEVVVSASQASADNSSTTSHQISCLKLLRRTNTSDSNASSRTNTGFSSKRPQPVWTGFSTSQVSQQVGPRTPPQFHTKRNMACYKTASNSKRLGILRKRTNPTTFAAAQDGGLSVSGMHATSRTLWYLTRSEAQIDLQPADRTKKRNCH
jgi:hypothetical protein